MPGKESQQGLLLETELGYLVQEIPRSTDDLSLEMWRDDFEDFGPDRWIEAESAWIAPELERRDGRRLVLDSPDPFPGVN